MLMGKANGIEGDSRTSDGSCGEALQSARHCMTWVKTQERPLARLLGAPRLFVCVPT
jgi:hypothetical protein